MKNESEVQQCVQNLGFAIVTLEDFTLDEQVMLFSNVKIIAGFHGAGLCNLLYSEAPTQLIEIVDRDCVYPCYLDGIIIPGQKATRTYFHMLSEMKNMDYQALESKNYTLDLDELRKTLLAALHRQSKISE